MPGWTVSTLLSSITPRSLHAVRSPVVGRGRENSTALPQRLALVAQSVPTALYSLFRAFFFDEAELADYLRSPRQGSARIIRDLAKEHGYRLVHRATGLTTPAALSRQAVHVMGLDQRFSNDRARDVLGWEPRVDYPTGMAATVAWLQE